MLCIALHYLSETRLNNCLYQVIVWIGYMRRYAPAFEEAVKIVRSMKSIQYARIRDIIGHVYTVFRTVSSKTHPDFPELHVH